MRRGTTLLEVLIVSILLMGVIGSITAFFTYMPRWSQTTTGQLTMMRESMAAASMLQGEISRAGDCACPSASEVLITNSATGDQWLYYLVPDPDGVAGRFEMRTSKDGKINYVRVAGLVKTLTCTAQPQYNGIDLCLVYEEMDGRLRRECAQFRRATSRTMEVKMADLDRDGFEDLVTVKPQQTYVQTYKGTVHGTFTRNVTSALDAGSEPRSIEVVDFDGNGKLDLAVLTSRDVQIMEADPSPVTNPAYDGALTYAVTQTIALPASAVPLTIAAGDLDGDGAVDLAVADYAGQCVQLFYGLTSNKLRFEDPVRWPTSPSSLPGRPRRIKLARMNTGDAQLDLIVGFGSPTVPDASVAIALGTGERVTRFAAAVAYPGGKESWDLDLSDVNRDGVLDVVSADWNRDRLALHTGNAAGTLNAASFTISISPTAVQFINADGIAPDDVGAVSRVRGITSSFNVYEGLAGGTIGTTLSAEPFTSTEVDGISAATGNVSPDASDGWAVAWMTADPGGVRTGLPSVEMFPGTLEVKAGDLNRDGKMDAVTVRQAVSQWPRYVVQTYEGQAGGTLNASVTVTLASPIAMPRSVEVEDFDRDGKLDLAVLTTKDVQILGSTTGYASGFTFAVGSTFALPSSAVPHALVAFDLDRDGRHDLVVSDPYNRCLYVYYGNGDGTFAADSSGARWPAVGTDFPGQPRRMAVGDVDRDGVLDVVVGMVNPASANRCIALAEGRTSRATKFVFATGSPYLGGVGSWDVALGDLVDEASGTNSRDGILDVVSADWSGDQVALLRGQSSGNLLGTATYTSTTKPSAVRFAQYTADAIPDVAVVSRVRGTSSDLKVYPGTTNGTLDAAGVITIGFGASIDAMSLWTGQVTRDGRDDWLAACLAPGLGGIVAGNAPLSPTNGLTTSSVAIVNTLDASSSAVVGDFNRDGHPDIVSPRSTASAVYFWLHNNSATPPYYTTRSNETALDDVREIVTGDFNRDARLDLVVTCELQDRVSFFRGAATPFVNKVDSTTDNGPDGIAVGDFDRDGDQDIVVTARNANTFRVMPYNSASNTFSNSTFPAYATGTTPNHIAAADLNQDGKLDVVTSNSGSDNITIRFGNGDGTFQAAITHSEGAGSDPNFVDVGDLDGDGILDIVVAHLAKTGTEVNGSAWVRFGKADFTWGASTKVAFDGMIYTGTTNRGLSSCRIADVDRDGDLDLVATGYSTGGTTCSRVGVAKNNGDGTFARFVDIAGNPGPAGNWAPADCAVVDGSRTGKIDYFVPWTLNNAVDPYYYYGN